MTKVQSHLKGKHILAVDDEADILETIEDILDEAVIDTARDYDTACEKIKANHYDLAVLDIMGVNGLHLLEETVAKNIPTVMLTAHAVNPETLMESIQKGAISYLPKESLVDLDELLNDLLSAYDRGEPPWKLLFEKLGPYFDDRFGYGWQQKNHSFWSAFNRSYQIGKGIAKRLEHDERLLSSKI
jgi:DNA-binding response OmpR family regulator